ncbi:hypothetical protein Bpfe_029683, partial [Biomphalaria pfeifferi]
RHSSHIPDTFADRLAPEIIPALTSSLKTNRGSQPRNYKKKSNQRKASSTFFSLAPTCVSPPLVYNCHDVQIFSF